MHVFFSELVKNRYTEICVDIIFVFLKKII